MDAQKRGDRSERRAFQTLVRLAAKYPDKFRRPRRVSPGTDARGLDDTIQVNVHKGKRKGWMTTPLQVKSSERGVEEWEVKHPDLHKAGVLCIYIRDDMDDDGLEALFYRALDKVRRNSKDGSLYHGMWQRLYQRGLSPRGRKNAREIAAKRERERQSEKK